MSTKTTFKRVALVAVAALGLGLLSVVPSQATTNADSLTVSAATAAQTTAETSTATNPTTTLSFLSATVADSMSVTASLVSGPATGVALPFLELVETASASIDTITVTGSKAVGAKINPNTPVTVSNTTATDTAARASAKFKVYLGNDSRTAPTVAGTYVVKLTPAIVTGTLGTINATAQTITFTVTAAATLDTAASAATSTVFLASGETTTATADATILGSKTASSSVAVASVIVTQKNAASQTNAAESMTATITGAGTLGAGASSTWSGSTSVSSVTSVGRSIIVKNGDIIQVFPDGTAGVGTITISTISGTVLGTKTVTFFGDVAAIVTAVRTTTLGVGANSSAIRATAYDAAGNLVSGASLYATSDATSVVSSSYLLGTGGTGLDIGTYDFNLTGVAKGTAKITVGLATSATDVTTTGYAIKADPVTVTVGGGAADLADILVSFDKASYAPGSRAMITVTPVDKLGKPLAPGTYTVFDQAAKNYTAGFVFSDTVTVLNGFTDMEPLPTTSVKTRSSNSTVTSAVTVLIAPNTAGYWVQLPNVESDFTLTYKTAAAFPGNPNNAGVTRSITVPLSLPGTLAAVDAAAEATDAANAATDAALAAADAADAATAAAEDASAAVAKLSKSVTTALNNLKKQITSLTALVNKLLKR
jgi:hypothetical protein